MTRTPWGDSSQLRARKLAPGQRLPPEAVARNQRWRLLAAVVAAAAEQGYDRTAVSHVVERSGVSRTAFYRHFANKEECFVTAVDETLGFAREEILRAYEREEEWADRLMAAFEALLEQIVAQPAAARVCLLEVYAAGERATAHADRGVRELERMLVDELERSPEHAGLAPVVIQGIVGGIRQVIATRLRLGREAELPRLAGELAAWAGTYRTPERPIRRRRIRAAATSGRPRPSRDDQVERIFVALVSVVREKGYGEMTLDDVAERAHISFTTFYNHFRTKEDAFIAAYDAGLARARAAAMPAYDRAADWPHAVRAGLERLLAFLAGEPDCAHAGIVSTLAAGRVAMARRDEAIASFEHLLEPGFEIAPDTPPIATEAIGGAIVDLLYRQIRRRGAERAPELLPVVTFIALAPFTGPDAAAEVANERSPRRARRPVGGAAAPAAAGR